MSEIRMNTEADNERREASELGGLLPCPFCGGKAEYAKVEDGGQYIRCTHCMATTALHYDRAESLDNSWNRRAG